MSEEVSKTVFLSHAASDSALAAQLSSCLEKNGFKTWYAERDILGGMSYSNVISSAIESCEFFVLLLSQAADSSNHVLTYFPGIMTIWRRINS